MAVVHHVLRPAKDSADHDLGVKTYIVIDTSTSTTDAIDYVAADTNGLTSTSSRTIIIEPAPAQTPPPPATSSTTTAL